MKRQNLFLATVYSLGIIFASAGIGHGFVCLAFSDKQAKQEVILDDYDEKMESIEEKVLGVSYTEEVPEYEPAYVLGDVEELHIEATAYCYGTTTASGKKVREGYAAMAKGYMGKTAIVYEDMDGVPGDLIGIYEIEDTGGDYRIQEGRCIDIYISDYDECVQFGRQNVIAFIIDAKG